MDLLLSCKHWPLVYAIDMACDVVAHAEARLPLMAEAMWGNHRGCFEKPCPERPPQVQDDLEWHSLQHSIAYFNLFYRFFICQSFNTYTVYQPPHQMLYWSTTMPRVWCTRSLWQQAGMWLVTDFMMGQQAQVTSVTHANTTTWDCVQNSPNSNQWPQKS